MVAALDPKRVGIKSALFYIAFDQAKPLNLNKRKSRTLQNKQINIKAFRQRQLKIKEEA